jgi:hypothetical protein
MAENASVTQALVQAKHRAILTDASLGQLPETGLVSVGRGCREDMQDNVQDRL